MIPRTKVHQDTELFERVKNSMPGRVTVRLRDGREFTDEVLYPKGNPGNPMTEDEFKAKFMDMAARVLGEAQARRAVPLGRATWSKHRRRGRAGAAVQSPIDRRRRAHMGMTSIEKILASHSDSDRSKAGDVVVVDVDVIVCFDSMRSDIVKIADPDKLVLLHDHQVPAPTVRAANMAKAIREFVEKFGVKNYFPVGQHGISHVLVAQEGIALPGKILANPDSHTCSSGALNCLARGHGPFGDAAHHLQGPDVVPGRPDDQDRDRRGAARAGVRAGRHPLHSRSSTATSPGAISSGTATGWPASTWTGG